MNPKPLTFGVILLAAGQSRRMGRPKLVLPWASTTILGHLIQQWRALGAKQIGVVCASANGPVTDELDRLAFPAAARITNPDPARGMFSSVQCAARWNGWDAALSHWVLTLGDQPHVRQSTLRTIIDFAAAHPDKICQPMRSGHRRHPVVFPRSALAALRESSATDLKAFLECPGQEWAGFESDDAGLDLDLDEPQDYERARALL